MRNDITCGSHNCWQISGGRDMLIADNKINGTTTDGVLTAGGTRISILRNRFHGMGMKPPAAAHLASPGAEWDNYAGVENMISSAIVVANNLSDGWANFVQLDAARDIAIVYNTVADGMGVQVQPPHAARSERQGDSRRQQQHQGVERHPAVDLGRHRRDAAHVRAKQPGGHAARVREHHRAYARVRPAPRSTRRSSTPRPRCPISKITYEATNPTSVRASSAPR